MAVAVAAAEEAAPAEYGWSGGWREGWGDLRAVREGRALRCLDDLAHSGSSGNCYGISGAGWRLGRRSEADPLESWIR